MPDKFAIKLSELPANTKKTVTFGDLKILLVRTDDDAEGAPSLFGLEAECPHAKAPLEKGAVCNGRLVCPWHAGTFALSSGKLLEPPPLRNLQRYAVQLRGDEVWTDTTPLPPSAPPTFGEGRSLVFAGAGAATAAALASLREAGFQGRITVIDPVSDEPVDRTQLTKNALAGKKDLSTLPLFAPKGQEGSASLEPLQIERRKAAVSELDRANRQMKLSTGEQVSYDAALLATGGRPKLLRVHGADLPHVFTIRHTADLQRMSPLLQEGRRVILVGDSFIAFEAASALRQRGLHTTILARSKQPFAKKFGPEVAEALMNLHRHHGVEIHSGEEVEAISPVSVTLQSGSDIPADLVVIAVGVEPALDFARDLPRSEDGGLQVGPNLQLAPGLWCAGDIASVDGLRIEHWRLAEQHGRTVAEAMLSYVRGEPLVSAPHYEGVPLFWTTHFGTRLNYAGHADTWDRIEYLGEPQSLEFLAFYIKEDLVAAVLGCKRDTVMAAMMEPLRHPLSLADAKQIAATAS